MANASEYLISQLVVGAGSFLLFTGSFHVNQGLDGNMLYAPGVSLIFIPAGVKLLCILVGGIPAAIGLFLASLFSSYGLWNELPPVSTFLFAGISVSSYGLAVFLVMRKFQIRRDLSNLTYWHVIVLSCFACLTNGIAHNVVYLSQGVTARNEFFEKSAAMAFGDFLGCFTVVMLISICVNRLKIYLKAREY